MKVTLWGTRGTFPVPGAETLRYGGNTTCVSVETPEHVLVIDTGTGIRLLGESLEGDTRDISVLYTHVHADHVMGFPFFKPLYDPDRTISLIDHRLGDREWSATALLDGMHFPLTPTQVPADLRRVTRDPLEYLADMGLHIRRTLLNHPGGAFGYRVEGPSGDFVFIPDNELHPKDEATTPFDDVVAFCSGAHVLAHDAQFTDEELLVHCGWGHSSGAQACELAKAAGVHRLLLTHHEPSRTDAQLEAIEESMRASFGGEDLDVRVARDGMSFTL